MTDLSKASIEPHEIISFLKEDIQLRKVYQQVLRQKVIDQAAQERELKVTPEEIQAEGDRFRHEKRLEKASDTLTWLADEMITVEDWEAGICNHLLSQKLAKSLFDKEVEKFFAQNRLNFDQVLLYQIVVPYEKLAQELFYQIEEEEISFFEVAHLYDIDETRRNHCGYEGRLDRWNLKSDIAAVVFGARPGELVGPLKTDQGYHLFRVEEFISAELTPERYQEILDSLFKDWLAGELNHMLHYAS